MTLEKQVSGGESTPRPEKTFYNLSISIFASLLIFSIAVAITVTVMISHKSSHKMSPEAEAVLKTACASTPHSDLCFSAISRRSEAAKRVTNHKSVLQLSLDITHNLVEKNYYAIKNLAKAKIRVSSMRERQAFRDCIEMVSETLDEIHKTIEELKFYPDGEKSLAAHTDNLKTFISTTMTDQDTCIAGFSNSDKDRILRRTLLGREENTEHMCGNVLALIKKLTDTDLLAANAEKRHLSEVEDGMNGDFNGWPKWLSPGDRRLLQGSGISVDAVVAADGSGNFTTITEAVAAAPSKSKKRYVIRIKQGVYRENVEVPKSKTNIMFLGDGKTTTIITASRNVVDGYTTFKSATVAVVGEGFLARGLTFQNTAGPSKHQAVALRVGSDFSAFYECDILAYQDTLYVHNSRQFFSYCLIVGTVDFIFGNAAALFQRCDIHARKPNPNQKNMITAQSRTDPNQNTGIVLDRCNIGATADLKNANESFQTYLGRPWKEFARTVVILSVIGDVVERAGWHEWNGDFALDTLYYGEYNNTGPGADTAGRVNWKGFHVMTNKSEAEAFTAGNFITGMEWLSATTFPYSLGL